MYIARGYGTSRTPSPTLQDHDQWQDDVVIVPYHLICHSVTPSPQGEGHNRVLKKQSSFGAIFCQKVAITPAGCGHPAL